MGGESRISSAVEQRFCKTPLRYQTLVSITLFTLPFGQIVAECGTLSHIVSHMVFPKYQATERDDGTDKTPIEEEHVAV
jgi:hypothetical protein